MTVYSTLYLKKISKPSILGPFTERQSLFKKKSYLLSYNTTRKDII